MRIRTKCRRTRAPDQTLDACQEIGTHQRQPSRIKSLGKTAHSLTATTKRSTGVPLAPLLISAGRIHRCRNRLEETQIERFIAGTTTLNMALLKHLTRHGVVLSRETATTD